MEDKGIMELEGVCDGDNGLLPLFFLFFSGTLFFSRRDNCKERQEREIEKLRCDNVVFTIYIHALHGTSISSLSRQMSFGIKTLMYIRDTHKFYTGDSILMLEDTCDPNI